MFDKPDSGGTVGASTGSKCEPGALEVLPGEIKFATTKSNFGIGLLARPDLPNGFAVDKRVLVSPGSSRLFDLEIQAQTRLRYIEWAITHTTDSDDTIVSRAKQL